MVVISRLQFVASQLMLGRNARISCNSYPNKSIVHITLAPISETMAFNQVAACLINSIMMSLHLVTAVDRGHSHSDGSARITISLKPTAFWPLDVAVVAAPSDGSETCLPSQAPADYLREDSAAREKATPIVAEKFDAPYESAGLDSEHKAINVASGSGYIEKMGAAVHDALIDEVQIDVAGMVNRVARSILPEGFDELLRGLETNVATVGQDFYDNGCKLRAQVLHLYERSTTTVRRCDLDMFGEQLTEDAQLVIAERDSWFEQFFEISS